MNKENRKKITQWIDTLETIKSEIEEMQAGEEDKYDNLPEGIQDSEKGEAICDAIENLGSAEGSLEDVIDYLNDAIGN